MWGRTLNVSSHTHMQFTFAIISQMIQMQINVKCELKIIFKKETGQKMLSEKLYLISLLV